ncbi:type II secretion system protein [Uliginosibacterium flavum]
MCLDPFLNLCLKSRAARASTACRLKTSAGWGATGTILKKSVRCGSSGFTLIEMIVVMTVTGILVSVVALFIRRPMEGLVDATRRAALADTADTAARRMRRDIQRALPNSVRVLQSGATWYIEFLPVLAAGRYCESVDCGAAPLDFSSTTASFSFAGPAPVLSPIPAGSEVAINNLGFIDLGVIDPSFKQSDAYTGDNTATLSAIGASTITLGGAKLFPQSSPGKRFFIIGSPVSYACTTGGNLTRISGYAKQASQPSPASVGSPILASNVAACSIDYVQSAIDQYGLLYLTLQIAQSGESVTLTHAIQINNTP